MKILLSNKTIIIVLIAFLFSHTEMTAQCAMCRAVLESEANQDAAKGINDGILYLMVFPYILVGGVLFFIYRFYKTR
ncbi:MAG: hypothetical protein U1C58_01280 [Flavobacteriaceae bacterium]|nr:hypothetical protein [Flavobacteriaceae bacterium]MDZ4146893.1 hypothetical protein [Flavobacteriaceae bacterium]